MLRVQVTIRYFIDEDPNYEDYEELTLTVKAESPTEAIEKAKHYALGYCIGYQNCFHETVRGQDGAGSRWHSGRRVKGLARRKIVFVLVEGPSVFLEDEDSLVCFGHGHPVRNREWGKS